MARNVREANILTRDARSRLEARAKPYWRTIQAGLHLGYRKPARGPGSWIERRFLGNHKYLEERIGFADDKEEADGRLIFSFVHAQDAARAWWNGETREDKGIPANTGPYTVADALKDYFAERERKGSKGVKSDRSASDARILPKLGDIEVAKLTTAKIRAWQSALAEAPRLVRAKS